MNLVQDHIKIKKILKWLIALNLILVICVIVAFLLIANIYNDMGELWEFYGTITNFLKELMFDHKGVNI